jgi:hypothetical protein
MDKSMLKVIFTICWFVIAVNLLYGLIPSYLGVLFTILNICLAGSLLIYGVIKFKTTVLSTRYLYLLMAFIAAVSIVLFLNLCI